MGYPDLPVFLGVGRFKGYWNASTNSGTLANPGPGWTGVNGDGSNPWAAHNCTRLFPSGNVLQRAPNELGGYHATTNLTATVGDFWKVSAAGTTPVDNEDTWRISDFVVFTYTSGSTSGSVWQKLSYTDTISSIMYGNGSGGSTVFGLTPADVHEFTGSLYVSGALYAEELNTTVHNHTVTTTHIAKSGSTAFGDSPGDQHIFSGSIYTGGNISVSGTWAENIASTHALTVHGDISGSGKILNVGGIETQGDLGATGSATIRGSTTFGSDGTDTHTFNGGLIINDTVPVRLSSSNTDFRWTPSSPRGLRLINFSSENGSVAVGYPLSMYDGYVAINSINLPTHALTVTGDISGSAKILNVGGIETQGNLGVTGSIKTLGDVSGSGKILNVGGIETQGNLGVTGSALFRGIAEHTGNVYIDGDLEVSSYIRHKETDDTYIRFLGTSAQHYAGGVAYIQYAAGTGMTLISADKLIGVAAYLSSSATIQSKTGLVSEGVLNVSGSTTLAGATKFGDDASDVHQFSGSVYVSGNVYAEQFHTTEHNHTVVSTTLHKSGSTTFGNTNDDTHTFTGRIIANEPVSVNDDLIVSGNAEFANATFHTGVLYTSQRIESRASPIFFRTTSSAQNTLFEFNQANRTFYLTDKSAGNTNYPFLTRDGKVVLGDNAASATVTHPVTIVGDLSGSGKIFNMAGIETAGGLGVSGSTKFGDNAADNHQVTGTLTTSGYLAVNNRFATHALTVAGDISGSGRALIYGGVETHGALGVTGSMIVRGPAYLYGGIYAPLTVGATLTVTGDISGSGKILNVGGIETQGDLGVTGSVTIRGTTSAAAIQSTANSYFSSMLAVGTTTPTHTLTVAGDISGSGKILNTGGIETQGELGVTGSIISRHNVISSGSMYSHGSMYIQGGGASSLYLTSTIAHYTLTTTSRDLRIYDYNDTTFPLWIRDGKVGLSNIAPSHALTVAGDISGSGKIFNVGGIETQGGLGVTGSATILGTSVINGNSRFATSAQIGYAAAASVTHPLMVSGDISGSGKIFNLGGIETAADLGVTGSVTAGNVMPRTDNTFDLGSESKRWANIYTGDLHLKNDRGDWTIVEEEEYLSVINNKTNKKYKMMLEEIED